MHMTFSPAPCGVTNSSLCSSKLVRAVPSCCSFLCWALLRMPVLWWGFVREKHDPWHLWDLTSYKPWTTRCIWPCNANVNCTINRCNLLYVFSLNFYLVFLDVNLPIFFLSLCKRSSSILDLRNACIEATKEELGSERRSPNHAK